MGTTGETNGSGRKQGGKRREKCLVVVGALLLMGQHELNTAAAIVYWKHYSKHESGENWGRELDMEHVHNGLLCSVGKQPSICVNFACTDIYARIHISYTDKYVCGSNGNHVCKCVCVCERHKIWTQLPLLITTRMCPSSFESRLFAVPLQMLSARTQTLPQDGRSESAVTSRTSEESKSLSLSDRRIY